MFRHAFDMRSPHGFEPGDVLVLLSVDQRGNWWVFRTTAALRAQNSRKVCFRVLCCLEWIRIGIYRILIIDSLYLHGFLFFILDPANNPIRLILWMKVASLYFMATNGQNLLLGTCMFDYLLGPVLWAVSGSHFSRVLPDFHLFYEWFRTRIIHDFWGLLELVEYGYRFWI